MQARQQYIFCPKCKMLLATVWTLYPEEPRNKIRVVCNRVLDNGEKCGEKVLVGTKEMLEGRGVNIEDVPESFKT